MLGRRRNNSFPRELKSLCSHVIRSSFSLPDTVCSVAAVVARVALPETPDGDSLRSDDAIGVVVGILDGLSVVDPLDFGRGLSVGLAFEGHLLALSGRLIAGLNDEPG